MAEADGSESIIRKEDSQAWDTFCVSCKKLGGESGETLLAGAITAKRVNGTFEEFAERVIQYASVFKEDIAKEATKFEGRLRVAAEAKLEKQLRDQAASIEARQAKALAAKDAEKEAVIAAHQLVLASRDEEIEKMKKQQAKAQTALQKTQSSLKMAQLKQEKSVGEIERLQNEIRKKSETVMTSLFNELELPFESGTKPQDMFKTIFANHEEEVKELKGELAKANKLIEKMQQSAADGNRDIIEERDALVAERDELAEKIKSATEAKATAERDAAAMRKEVKDVHAAAKAEARGEVEEGRAEIAKLKDAERMLQGIVANLEQRLEGVQTELSACSKQLKLAHAAGAHGGYYFSAAVVPKSEVLRKKAVTSRVRPGSLMQRGQSAPQLRGAMASGWTQASGTSVGGRRGSRDGSLPSRRSSKDANSSRRGSRDLGGPTGRVSNRAAAPAAEETATDEVAAGAHSTDEDGTAEPADLDRKSNTAKPVSPERKETMAKPIGLERTNPGLLTATFSVKLAEGAKSQGMSLSQVGAAAAAAAAAAKQKKLEASSASSKTAASGKDGEPKRVLKKKKSKTTRSRAKHTAHEALERESTERC